MSTEDARSAQILCCSRCSAELQPGRGELYYVKILAVADPSPPQFTPEDLAGDPASDIQRLLRQLRGASEEELMNQVFRRRLFVLCVPCYERWVEEPFGR